MQIPYSFLEKSANSQFKDMAFFQILKRKGPYIERSITKIQNDLFYKHKLSSTKMKNVSFIRQIRLTLAAYETIVNQIKNDFMMTELDSMGDSIHKLFVQMLSIIKFLSTMILKKEKQTANDTIEVNLQKEKEQILKKLEEDQRAKQQKQNQNSKFKEMQKLKHNFHELFKMQMGSEKENQLIESLWKTIVTETKTTAKECILIKDSQLSNIIKDSCEYMYKNHSELDNIIRLTKQDIIKAEKNMEIFTDKQHLLDQNQQNIHHMKQVARKIVQVVRERVYDRKEAAVQTSWTNVDASRPFVTVKDLDDKRKLELRIKNYEKTTQERLIFVDDLEMRLKKTQEMLKIVNQKLEAKDTSSSDEDEEEDSTKKHVSQKIPTHSQLPTKFTSLTRKSQRQNFNSFKVSPKVSINNKIREVSFTTHNKKFTNLSKNSSSISQNPLYQKTSNRSSSTSKDFAFNNNRQSQNGNIKSTNELSQSKDDCRSISQKSQKSGEVVKKLYQVRESHLVLEAMSFDEISRRDEMSRAVFQEDDHKEKRSQQVKHAIVSIEDLKTYRDSQSLHESNHQIPVQEEIRVEVRQKNSNLFSITQTCKMTVRPLYHKRYIQSTYKHPVTQEKQPQTNLSQSKLLKLSKFKKATSHHELSRYYFQPLDNIDRLGHASMYKEKVNRKEIEKRKILSATASPQFNPRIQEKQNLRNYNNQNLLNVPGLNAVGFIKLKNQKFQKKNSLEKQHQSIIKSCIKSTLQSKRESKKDKNQLKKSSSTKQAVSFVFLPGAENNLRKSSHTNLEQSKLFAYTNQIHRIPVGQPQIQYPLKVFNKSAIISSKKVIREQIEVLE